MHGEHLCNVDIVRVAVGSLVFVRVPFPQKPLLPIIPLLSQHRREDQQLAHRRGPTGGMVDQPVHAETDVLPTRRRPGRKRHDVEAAQEAECVPAHRPTDLSPAARFRLCKLRQCQHHVRASPVRAPVGSFWTEPTVRTLQLEYPVDVALDLPPEHRQNAKTRNAVLWYLVARRTQLAVCSTQQEVERHDAVQPVRRNLSQRIPVGADLGQAKPG